MPFTPVVLPSRRALRSALGAPLSCAGVLALLACPQLLSDDFDGPALGAGGDGCALPSCAGRSGAAGASNGGAGGNGGAAGESAGGPATEGGAPNAGGEAGGAGSPGGSQQPGTLPDASTGNAGDSGAGGSANCRIIHLVDDTQSAVDNCIGVYGWNNIVVDPDTETRVARSYEGGAVCFAGTIEADGWGAVYNLTFSNDATWDATAFGVEGFALDAAGAALPPELEVVYTDQEQDFCDVVTPAASLSIPFDSTHPDCTETPGATTPNELALTHLRLHFPALSQPYSIDLCLHIRAIP